MESVRVYGNDFVHNVREIQVDDDQTTAIRLFEMINFIIDQTITLEKQIDQLYNPIPSTKKRVPEDVQN